MNFGLAEEEGHWSDVFSGQELPTPEQTQVPVETRRSALKQMFLWGSKTFRYISLFPKGQCLRHN